MTTIEQEPESHPFPPFIPDNATTLIVGSFPGMEQVKNRNNPEEWFYSAADNLFWKIVSNAFKTELKTVQEKKEFCRKYGVGITDVFTKIKRKNQAIETSALKKWNITRR